MIRTPNKKPSIRVFEDYAVEGDDVVVTSPSLSSTAPSEQGAELSPPPAMDIRVLSSSPLLSSASSAPTSSSSAQSEVDKQLSRRQQLEIWKQTKKQKQNKAPATRLNAQRNRRNVNTVAPTRSVGQPQTTIQKENVVNHATVRDQPLNDDQDKKRKANTEQTNNMQQRPTKRVAPSADVVEQPATFQNPPSVREGKIDVNTNLLTQLKTLNQHFPSTEKLVPIRTTLSEMDQFDEKHLNISVIPVVEDKVNVEEDKHMLENIVKITDSLEEIPNLANSAVTTTIMSNNASSILLDASGMDIKSTPRRTRRSLKQKSFGISSSFLSPIPLNLATSTAQRSTITTPKIPKNPYHFYNHPNWSSLFIEENTPLVKELELPPTPKPIAFSSPQEEIEYLKSRIEELETSLKREATEKQVWKESYKSLILSSNPPQTNLTTNHSQLSVSAPLAVDGKGTSESELTNK